MRDFTVHIYRELLRSLKAAGYEFQTFQDFLQAPKERAVMLRHDVDARRFNSLAFARIQREMGIVGTYFFRMVPQSFDPAVIREILGLGHEIGYHYEDMDFAKGDPHQAIRLFEQHLEQLRAVAPVSTICMHGSPRSKFDNRLVWKHYDYREYGIIGEPYFDLDFNQVFYLTDTGRRWDGYAVSVRDKVQVPRELHFRSTRDVIRAVESGRLPDQVMFNFHPQRWIDSFPLWLSELGIQYLKNAAKYLLIKLREEKKPVEAPVLQPPD